MNEALNSELIHVPCGKCQQIATFSLGSLEKDNHPVCPYCGAAMTVDLAAAEKDGLRKAQELDQSVDALGSAD